MTICKIAEHLAAFDFIKRFVANGLPMILVLEAHTGKLAIYA